MDTMFELLWLKATQSRIDQDQFTEYKRLRADHIRNRLLNPDSAFNDALTEAMYGQQLRRVPDTLKTLELFDLKKSRDYLRQFTSDWSGTTFVFTGKFELASIKPRIEKWIGGIPTTKSENSGYKDLKIRTKKGNKLLL